MALLPKGYKRLARLYGQIGILEYYEKRRKKDLIRAGKDLHDYQRGWPKASFSWHISIPFHAFFLMAKDVIDTFKPYKDWSQVRTNLAQPFYGLGNLLKSLWMAALLLVFLAIDILGLPFWFGRSIYRYSKGEKFEFRGDKVPPTIFFCFFGELYYLLMNFIMLIGLLVRGVSQLATYPLTLGLKMPLRGILTAIYGRPNVLMSNNIQELLEIGQSTDLLDKEYAFKEILRKLNRAKYRGQNIGFADFNQGLAELGCKVNEDEIIDFDPATADGATKYSLFDKVARVRTNINLNSAVKIVSALSA